MRKLILPAILAPLVLPTPAMAQDAGAAPEIPLAEMADRMRDGDHQRDMALMLQAMTEVLLDMPIAPLAQAAADMAGEKAEDIDPDLTLRRIAPDAGRMSDQVARNVPRAMEAAGTMAEGMATLTPVLRDMAARMRAALPARD